MIIIGHSSVVYIVRYIPILLWGKSGHIQTVTYAKIGRFNCPTLESERKSIVMHDGATITYDIFQPQKPHVEGEHIISKIMNRNYFLISVFLISARFIPMLFVIKFHDLEDGRVSI